MSNWILDYKVIFFMTLNIHKFLNLSDNSEPQPVTYGLYMKTD